MIVQLSYGVLLQRGYVYLEVEIEGAAEEGALCVSQSSSILSLNG